VSAGDRQLWAHPAGDLELVECAGLELVLELRGTTSYAAELEPGGDRSGILVTRLELAELVRYCLAHGIVPTAATRAP
jgi:hypothetical protein